MECEAQSSYEGARRLKAQDEFLALVSGVLSTKELDLVLSRF
jgi:hypothetical protein